MKRAIVLNLRYRKHHPSHPLPPSDIFYLKKELKKRKIDTVVIDYYPSSLLTKLLINSDADYLIIKPTLDTLKNAIEISKKVKKYKSTEIFLVGPAVKYSPKSLLEDAKHIDGIVFGEYEFLLPKLLERKLRKKIIDAGIKTDIKKIGGFIPRNLGVSYTYFYPSSGIFRRKIGFILFSRGCPINCLFCSELHRSTIGKLIRCRDPKDVLKEMKEMEKKGINYIVFLDDNFLVNPLSQELIKLMIKHKVKMRYAIETHIGWIDENVLKLLKKSGCSTISIGLESFNYKLLRRFKGKAINSDEAIRTIKLIKKYGIKVVLFLMIGFPGEKFEDIKKDLELCKKINPDMIQISFFNPIPGSPIFNRIKNKKDLIYSQEVYENININLSNIPTTILKKIRKHFYIKFYTNPKFLFATLKQLPNIMLNFPVYVKLVSQAFRFFTS